MPRHLDIMVAAAHRRRPRLHTWRLTMAEKKKIIATCFLCGAADGLMLTECGPACADEAACAERLATWRPTGVQLRRLNANPGFASGGTVQPAQDGDGDDSVPVMLDRGCVFFSARAAEEQQD